ncbi:MAG: phospholipase [Spirochaetes bacterium]|jgi:predicted esterase|nr:phospholipase [Spirochaetota bacterium]
MKPHQQQPIRHAGQPVEHAEGAMILLHGKGASADNLVDLSELLDCDRISYLAPQAENGVWFPRGVADPISRNQPHVSASLELIDGIVKALAEAGVPRERIVLMGFCQGACLALEYVLHRPGRYGGVYALSGALLGEDSRLSRHKGDLQRTPVFLGSSDIDFMVPRTRLLDTAELMRGLNAEVSERLYPGMPHTINREEVDLIRDGLLDLFHCDA